MDTTYVYRPLTANHCIRLLSLEPDASLAAPLRCSLQEISIGAANDSIPHYDALSYVWGANTGTLPLLCDGRTLLVTPNCESALRRLRSSRRHVTLWVDAICIDQNNVSERGHQVSLMGDIYRKATKVIIWLGEGSDNTARCFSRIKRFKRLWEHPYFDASTKNGSKRAARKLMLFYFAGMSTEDLCNLLIHEWASRLWTVQELYLAATAIVMCGAQRLPWDSFYNLCNLMGPGRFNLKLQDNGLTTLASLERWYHRHVGSHSMLSSRLEMSVDGRSSTETKLGRLKMCTTISQMNECKDPLDKIYALYGLLTDVFDDLPDVSYENNERSLYADFTRATILSSRKFWPASLRHWRSDPGGEIPSWCVDLVLGRYEPAGLQSLLNVADVHDEDDMANASLATEVCLVTPQLSVLDSIAVKGVEIFSITRSGGRWPNVTAGLVPAIHCLNSWVHACAEVLHAANPYNDRDGLILAVEELLTSKHLPGHREAARTQIRTSQEELQRSLDVDIRADIELDPVYKWSQQVLGHKIGVAVRMSNSELFVTSTGHIGVSMGYLEVGDRVALIAGGDHPVLLRRRADEHWRCVGSAYIAGIMRGEAWPTGRSVEELNDFTLI